MQMQLPVVCNVVGNLGPEELRAGFERIAVFKRNHPEKVKSSNFQ
jgi:hypothetical protein